ncbi:hemin-degrading factor [Burkholderia sp. WAC0059]|uniref:hemin-degrading factor n=1 Tax=Burkholderia sp. WAC0059 TaxID=2066022 RepID=UPI000C7F0EB1|nr:ChuX/HutX family heme-like substrate-binding protein [Burkholderia sp. WAC0059]PLZ03701.1 hemin-degrading factor [Burkholderia sp. WAC0059]
MTTTHLPTDFDDPQALARWRDAYLAVRQRGERQREAAHAMRVCEAQAVAAFVGVHAVRLRPDFMNLIAQLPRLGPVLTLTRNEAAVHEKEGRFERVSEEDQVGLVLGSAIDLRVFHRVWGFAFAVREPAADGERKSLQFFDTRGQAVFKVYLRPRSDHAAYDALATEWAVPQRSARLNLAPAAPAEDRPSDDAVDVTGLRAAWDAMNDVHDFFPLLRRFQLARTQALRLAGPDYAIRVERDSIGTVLRQAARDALPIMVFVGNPGMIQIHTGPVQKIHTVGSWLNVLDDDFNLHLQTALVDSVWVVKKPTREGIVTSVELFDKAGENIALLFGARKPGTPELPGWRSLAGSLPPESEEARA